MEKTLLVVGGSSDMGMALIESVQERYGKILVHYRRESEQLTQLKQKLGDRLVCFQADLADAEQVSRMIGKIRQLGLQPDHICHFAAGPMEYERFHKLPWEVFEQQLNISFRSLVQISQAFLPGMLKKKQGKLVVMLSCVVGEPVPGHCAAYVSAKYAMLGLVKGLATEYAAKGITVNGVSPTWVSTKFLDNVPDCLVQMKAQSSPLGRSLRPDEVVPTVRYLLSPEADRVTGQNIFVMGGTQG